MILAILNNKGGVGKTTSAVHIAYELAQQGKKVLCVDVDAQANLLIHIFPRHEVYELETRQNGKVLPVVAHPSGVDVLALSYYEGTAKQYADAIKSHAKNYDITIIDCPPSLEIRTTAALDAATSVLIPTQPENLSYNGLVKLLTLCEARSLPVMGIFVTFFDKKKTAHNIYLQQIASSLSKYFLDAIVPNSAVFSSASGMNKFGQEWSKNNTALKSYTAIATHILSVMEKERV
jgi:chromosome partitioning protein